MRQPTKMPTLDQLMARQRGEKAAFDADPQCPYVRPDLVRAWREGLRIGQERFADKGPLALTPAT